jgi:hypothetical protein
MQSTQNPDHRYQEAAIERQRILPLRYWASLFVSALFFGLGSQVSDVWSSPLPLIALGIFDILSLFSIELLRGFYWLFKNRLSHTVHEIVVLTISVNLGLVIVFGIPGYLELWPSGFSRFFQMQFAGK